MIRDASQPGAVADLAAYDACVVGAGAAGITLALTLADAGKRVALCEGGDISYSNESQDMYIGDVLGDPYYDLDTARLRFLGGSTNHWQGLSRSFDEIDFQRGYLGPEFEWPITKADIDPYLPPAGAILEIDPTYPDRLVDAESGFSELVFRKSPPVNFAIKYEEALAASDKIDLIVNANLLDLEPVENGGAVRQARFANYTGDTFTIEAASYTLSMGGIENSRQMLWIQNLHGDQLIGTDLPVGHYWMEHPHYTLGDALVSTELAGEKRRYYGLSGARQRELGILNCGLRIDPKSYEGSKQLVANLACVAPRVGKWAARQFEMNMICGSFIRAAWEQSPTHGSRIALSPTKRDPLGIPQPELRWTKGPLDRATIVATLEAFGEFCLDIEAGRVHIDRWVRRGEPYPMNDERVGYHHMGGTRMAKSREYGVVDADCRVFGVANLYVAGSSVFTTGGHANPTLPLVQMALRLADHLNATT